MGEHLTRRRSVAGRRAAADDVLQDDDGGERQGSEAGEAWRRARSEASALLFATRGETVSAVLNMVVSFFHLSECRVDLNDYKLS